MSRLQQPGVTSSRDDTLDKEAKFGPGPWQSEPDRVEWRYRDLPCLIVRGPIGSLCGYVGLPPGHRWHGADYDNIGVQVHGGLTFANKCGGHICHVPRGDEPEHVWWIGFDCAHLGDVVPEIVLLREMGVMSSSHERDGFYRTIDYVMEEVENLAQQVAEAER